MGVSLRSRPLPSGPIICGSNLAARTSRAGATGAGQTLLLALFAAAGCAAPLARHELAAPAMGTIFRVVLYAPDPETAAAAARAALDRVHELDARLSDYDGRSELSRLCGAGPHAPTVVSEDLWRVLAAAQRISRESGGAFDVTVGPLVRLWRRARREGSLPAEERRIKALESVGHEHLRLDPERRTVELLRPDMQLDLGGIAKGYAADEALAVLRRRGIRRALVDGGGDIAAGDPPPGREGWVIALPPAQSDGGPMRDHVVLANRGIATSGDAFRFVELGGVRYSHIVDPLTGLGLTGSRIVTVVAPDATTADALASAISVAGPERAAQVLRHHPGTAVLVRTASGGVELVTSGFPEVRGVAEPPGTSSAISIPVLVAPNEPGGENG